MRSRLIRGPFPLLLVLLFLVAGCDWDSAGDSLFDPNYEPSRPDPVVTTVEPSNTTLAGVGRVVIHGSNFASEAGDNVVLFNEERAEIQEASTERLMVRAPNLIGDEVDLRVAVIGAENFSDARQHRLIPAIESRGLLAPQDAPRGMTVDAEGNVYVALMRGALPRGIFRIPAEGGQAENIVGEEAWTYVDMTMHPDGNIYMARGALAVIYRMDPGGSPQVWLFRPALGPVNRLATDEWGNVWAGGASDNIHRITPDQDVESFPMVGDIRGIAYGEGTLFVSVVRTVDDVTVGELWRAPISATSTGEFEVLLNLNDHPELEGATPAGVEVREDGSVFLATSRSDYSLLHVQSDGSWESFYGVLPSMRPLMTGLSGAPNNYLYAARQGENPGVYRIDLQWREGR